MNVIWIDSENWVCPNCKSRPPGNALYWVNEKSYCVYCGNELIFMKDKEVTYDQKS